MRHVKTCKESPYLQHGFNKTIGCALNDSGTYPEKVFKEERRQNCPYFAYQNKMQGLLHAILSDTCWRNVAICKSCPCFTTEDIPDGSCRVSCSQDDSFNRRTEDAAHWHWLYLPVHCYLELEYLILSENNKLAIKKSCGRSCAM